mmetsp:Transcript_55869/g.104824  ORF Transcript_55869/g.104824 Transcript_55869/m.104824 type:complete len:353 (+) Transcript_55869:434-1492(+)
MHPVIRHTGFGQENVHLSGHPPSHGMNGEARVDFPFLQEGGNVGHGPLRLGHRHAVARHNHDLLGIQKEIGHCLWLGFPVLLDLNGTLLLGRRHSHAAEDDIHDIAVHGITHDLRQDRSAEADQRTHHSQSGAPQKHALCDQRPAGIRVQHSDAAGHVSAAHRAHQVDTHCRRQSRGAVHEGGAEAGRIRGAEHPKHAQLGCSHPDIEHVLVRQVERLGAKVAVQFAKSNKTAGEGDSSNGISKHRTNLVSQRCMRMDQVTAQASSHCGRPNQRVEGCDGLGKSHGADGLAQTHAGCAARRHQAQSRRQLPGWKPRKRHGHGTCDAGDAERQPKLSRLLRRQTADGPNAHQS